MIFTKSSSHICNMPNIASKTPHACNCELYWLYVDCMLS